MEALYTALGVSVFVLLVVAFTLGFYKNTDLIRARKEIAELKEQRAAILDDLSKERKKLKEIRNTWIPPKDINYVIEIDKKHK